MLFKMAEDLDEGEFEFRSRVEQELDYFTDLALNETQRWIETVTRLSFVYPEDPRKSLENGVLLCSLLNSIKPGTVKRINKLPTPIAGLDNLNVFLRACEEHFGLKRAQLFDPGDLQDLSNRAIAESEQIKQEVDRRLRNVCITIYWLGRALQNKFQGPKLDLHAFAGLIAGFDSTIELKPLEHKYEKHYTQSYYQEPASHGRQEPASHGRQASSDSLDYSSAYGSLRSGEHLSYREEQQQHQVEASLQHFPDSSYDSSGSLERPFSDEGHSGEDVMPGRENPRRHSSSHPWRSRDENPRFSATFDASYTADHRFDRPHYRSDDNLSQDDAREAYNRFRYGDQYSSHDSLVGTSKTDDPVAITRPVERKTSAAHPNPNQFIATKVSPLAKTAEAQMQISTQIKEIRHKITHDDEEWKSNLTNWKQRRRSASASTTLALEEEDDNRNRRKPKPSAETMLDKSRRASGYFGYSTRNTDDGDADDEAIVPVRNSVAHSAPPSRDTGQQQEESEEGSEEESSEESSDDEFVGPQLIHQSKRSTVMLTSAREGYMRLVVNMNLPREEYLEDKGWGLTIKGGKDKGIPVSIASVAPESAAAEAGLKVGDEITAINAESMSECNHGYVVLQMNKAANVMGRMEVFIRRAYKPGELPVPADSTKTKDTPYKPVPSRGPAQRKIGMVQQKRIDQSQTKAECSPELNNKTETKFQEDIDGAVSASDHMDKDIVSEDREDDDEEQLAESYQNILEQDPDSKLSTLSSELSEDTISSALISTTLESQPPRTAELDSMVNKNDFSHELEKKPKRNWQASLKASWQEKQDDNIWSSLTNESSIDDVSETNGVSGDCSMLTVEKEPDSSSGVDSSLDDPFISLEMAKVEEKIQQQRLANQRALGDDGVTGVNERHHAVVEDKVAEHMQVSAPLAKLNNQVTSPTGTNVIVNNVPRREPEPVAPPKSRTSLIFEPWKNSQNKSNLESRVEKDFEDHLSRQRPSSTSFSRRAFSMDQERKRMEDWAKEQERQRQPMSRRANSVSKLKEKYEKEQADLHVAYSQRTQELEKRKQQAKDVQEQKIKEMEEQRLREAQRYREEQKRLLEEQRQRTEQLMKEEKEKKAREEEKKRVEQEHHAREEERRLEDLRKRREEAEAERLKDAERKEEEYMARQRKLNEDRKRALEEQRQREAELKKKREEDRQREIEREKREKEEEEREKRRERERKSFLLEKERQLREQEERLRQEKERLRQEEERLQHEKEEQQRLWLLKQEEIQRVAMETERKLKLGDKLNSSDDQIHSGSPTSLEVSSYKLQQRSSPVKLDTEPEKLSSKPVSAVKEYGGTDSPVFMSRQDVLKMNRKVSYVGEKEWEREADSPPAGSSAAPKMQLKKEFVPKPWNPPSRENSPPKQKVFPKVAPKPFKSVRSAVEEEDLQKRFVDTKLREDSPPLSRDDVLKMNRKPPPGVIGYEKPASPQREVKMRSEGQVPVDKKNFKSLNAVPRPRQIRDDGWILAEEERERKREEAKNRRRSDWIKPHEPLKNPHEHWLVQEAERRRIAEKQERERQQKLQQERERIEAEQLRVLQEDEKKKQQERERQDWLRAQQQPSKETSPVQRPDWLIDATREELVSKATVPTYQTQPQELYGRPPSGEVADRFGQPVSENSILPSSGPQRSPSSKPSPGGSLNSSQDEDVLSVSAKQLCAYCQKELGRGAAMVIESLNLYYHVNCFRCCVCHTQLSNGNMGADVRVRVSKLHCKNCYSNDEAGIKYSQV